MLKKNAGLEDLFNKSIDNIMGGLKTTGNTVLVTLPAVGLAAGYGLAKLTSPAAMAEVSDKEMTRNALETEIAATERHIAVLEARKRNRQKKLQTPSYDRFV